MQPGFYPKNLLMLAIAYQKLGRTAQAASWRARCLQAKPMTPEDLATLTEAEKLRL